MTETDTSLDRRIGRDWVKSFALAGICLAVVAANVYGIQMEPDGAIDRRFQSGSYVILPLMGPFALFVLFRLLIPFGALVRLSPDGFVDLRAGRETIPWGDITNIVRRGEFVVLTMRRGLAKTYRLSLTQRLLKSRRKSLGPSHIIVADWLLNTRNSHLFELMTAYRAAHGAA